MKHVILKVLDRHKDGQLNMASKSAREMLAAEIEAVLIQDEQIKSLTRELYRGEG